MQPGGFFADALRSLMFDTPCNAEAAGSGLSADAPIDAGLGPIFYYVIKNSNLQSRLDPEMKFKASDLTARFQSEEQFNNVGAVVDLLAVNSIDPVLLKGVAFATRYYPEPHQRIMGDIDLLIPPDSISTAEGALLRDGFRKLDSTAKLDYDRHIHSAPLFHPDRKLWVELHRHLLPATFSPSEEAPLNLSTLDHEIETCHFESRAVKRFRPEFELIYLAAGWCRDLTHGFGHPGLQRSLVDCTLILKNRQAQMDWARLLHWSERTLSGSCLYVLLSVLKRLDVFDDRDNVCAALGSAQHYINAITLRIMLDRVEKHIVQFVPMGRLTSASAQSRLFSALIHKRSAWRNLLRAPGATLFPRDDTAGHAFRYHAARMRRLLRRRP